MSPYKGSFVLMISSSLADKELDDAVLELMAGVESCLRKSLVAGGDDIQG